MFRIPNQKNHNSPVFYETSTHEKRDPGNKLICHKNEFLCILNVHLIRHLKHSVTTEEIQMHTQFSTFLFY
jgi:hypothetical protein